MKHLRNSFFCVWLKCRGTFGSGLSDSWPPVYVCVPQTGYCCMCRPVFLFLVRQGFSGFIVKLYSLFYIAASCSHYRSTYPTCHTTVRDWRTDDVTARDQDHNALCRVMSHSAYKEEFKCCTLSLGDYRGTDVWRADWFTTETFLSPVLKQE